jgi:hypothetical protein
MNKQWDGDTLEFYSEKRNKLLVHMMVRFPGNYVKQEMDNPKGTHTSPFLEQF